MNAEESQAPFLTPGVKQVIGVTLLYMIAAVVGAFQSGNKEFVIYIAVMVVLFGVVGYVHSKVRLMTATLWALTGWGAAHMAGGLVPVPEGWPINGDIRVLYSWWIIDGTLKYDHVVHAYGFGVTTWVCWQALGAAFRGRGAAISPSFGLLTLCVVAGMGFGAVNEVIEFTATLLVPETNVGGYVNTGWDLVSNLSGCVVAAVLIRALNRQ